MPQGTTIQDILNLGRFALFACLAILLVILFFTIVVGGRNVFGASKRAKKAIEDSDKIIDPKTGKVIPYEISGKDIPTDREVRKALQREKLKHGRTPWTAIFLYLLTLFLEFPGIGARAIFGFIFAPIALLPVWFLLVLVTFCSSLFGLTGIAATSNRTVQGAFEAATVAVGGTLGTISVLLMLGFVFVVSFGPPIMSILTLFFLPGGFLLTRLGIGARRASRREHEAIRGAITQIVENGPDWMKAPTRWFIVDQNELNAWAIGTTLYITRALVKSPYLAGVLAHVLGHINSSDGRLVLALRRFVFTPVNLLSQATNQIAPGNVSVTFTVDEPQDYAILGGLWIFYMLLALAGGGLGLHLLNPFWIWYWRSREYEADFFAFQCGMSAPLVEYLEQHEYFDIATPYFMSPHPYIELRIDNLLAYEEGRAVVEEEPVEEPTDIPPEVTGGAVPA